MTQPSLPLPAPSLAAAAAAGASGGSSTLGLRAGAPLMLYLARSSSFRDSRSCLENVAGKTRGREHETRIPLRPRAPGPPYLLAACFSSRFLASAAYPDDRTTGMEEKKRRCRVRAYTAE